MLSKNDEERRYHYETAMDAAIEILNTKLESESETTKYLRKFVDVFEDYNNSKDGDERFAGFAMLAAAYPKIVSFFYDKCNIGCTRCVMCNLLTFIFNIAARQRCAIHSDDLTEMGVLIASFHDRDVKINDCLKEEDVEQMITHWNRIKNPSRFMRHYVDKWDTEDGENIGWGEAYGFLVCVYLYLSNTQPIENKIFVDHNTEYIAFNILADLSKRRFTIHDRFLKKIGKSVKSLKKCAI